MPLPRLSRFRAITPRAVDGSRRPFLPPVPDSMPPPGYPEWLSRIARTLNAAIAGNINVIADVLLTTGTETVVFDDRIGLWSVVLAMPETATAAAAMNGMYFVPGPGQVTIYHATDVYADRFIRLAIFG
jgi:hypothetical protein